MQKLKKLKAEIGFYKNWRNAGNAAQKMAIGSVVEYRKKCKQNPRLPLLPEKHYPDFPGYDAFLGQIYKTWREASCYVGEAGVTTMDGYEQMHKKNRLLPERPDLAYRDYPGDERFLNEFQDSYKRARFFVKKNLGIKSLSAVRKLPKPKNPNTYYKQERKMW